MGMLKAGFVIVAVLAQPAWGQSPSASPVVYGIDIDAKCPDAVREVREIRARTPVPRVPDSLTRPALRENLLLMVKQDQEARAAANMFSGDFNPANNPALARMLAVDAANLRRLKHIVNQDGFPTAQMVGLDGVGAAWLLAIHAGIDADFQEKVLQITRGHVSRGEVRSDQAAMLMDDVLMGRGKPQRYGTNFELRDGELKPAPMEDEATVDTLRRSVGLESLANYTCVIRAANAPPAAQAQASP